MKKWILAFLTVLFLAFLTETEVMADEGDSLMIALTDVPAYGVNRPIQGMVCREDGQLFDTAAYRISLFVQLSEGGQSWVKPTYAEPYVELFSDGSFSGTFITGGSDEYAKVVHVMLVPADYTPRALADTRSIALDYVKITRTEAGAVTVEPARSLPELPYVEPAKNALLPVAEDKLAVNIGFYTDGSRPGSELGELLIRRQLAAVAAFADTVRFYSAGGEIAKAYGIARDMGFSVVGTAWLSGDAEADRAEMDALIEHCNAGCVQVACVGNETLYRADLTADELIADIRYVRERIDDSSIPVTTSDTVDRLIANPSVRNACNLIMPNIYPYWSGTAADAAGASFVSSAETIKAVSGGKQILVSETGWPTEGSGKGSAVPGEEAAAAYFDEIRSWSLAAGTQVLWFEAADEPWKSLSEGTVGGHWGLMTTDFELKDGYKETEFFKAHPYSGPGAIDIAEAVMSGLTDQVYTGRAVTPELTVKLGTITLAAGTDYVVSFRDNIEVGIASVTVTGKGYFAGTIGGTFRILFKDVTDKNSWYYEPVYWAFDNGVTSGYGKGTFQPTAELTRAQTVMFLYKMAGQPAVEGLPGISFSDVSENEWYYKAVRWAAAKEITTGYGEGTFRPGVTCSRAMIVTFLMRYMKSAGKYKAPTTRAEFSDIPDETWYREAVDWAVENEVTTGYGEGTFRPGVTCNRAMMVTFLRRAEGEVL